MTGGGHFSLSVRVDEREALVTVLDDGASIPNEVLWRALELALARRFVERSYTTQMPLETRPLAASAADVSRAPAPAHPRGGR